MKYNSIVPKDSFVGKYMEYMSVVETPYAYDFWCAMWAIGVGSGRSVFVDRPRSPIYLNWYIILASESGTTRKSTAVRAIGQVVSDSGYVDEDCLIAGECSPRVLKLLLHERTQARRSAEAHFNVSELVSVLGKESHLSSMPGLLTDLYDCADVVDMPGTVQHGPIHMENIYVSLLSACTPGWLVTAINPAVVEGGFASRVIYVAEEHRKKSVAWPQRSKVSVDEDTNTYFRRTCDAAREVGAIAINKGGLEKFTAWYNSRTTHNDPFQSSFEAREDDHALRLAACLAINDGILEIQSRHIELACRVIADIKTNGSRLFGGGITTSSRIGDGIDVVRRRLVEAGMDGLPHSRLYLSCRHKLDKDEFKMLMSIMHECGFIQKFDVKGTRGKIYRATQAMESLNVTSVVMAKLSSV